VQTNCQATEECSHECPDCEDVAWFNVSHESGGDEPADCEGSESDGKEIRCCCVGDRGVDFSDVVDEK